MNGDLGRRLARLEAPVPVKPSANKPLSLAACNQLRRTIGEPLMTGAKYAAYVARPPLDPDVRQGLLSQLLEGTAPRG